ncbi:MAG TPA: anaerobic ribonucleoside-triphosphate reductase [Bacillota bacterium]|nr:anaerobic ribonucleoside-triphosphate reductase [Bacillota bacterium]
MIYTIKKRDGRMVVFKKDKIKSAIMAAARAVGGDDEEMADRLTAQVIKYIENRRNKGEDLTVESVQDAVEKVLIEQGHAQTAKAYIIYRNNRTRIREAQSDLMDAVQGILQETSKENANVTHSPMAKMLQIASAGSRSYYLSRLMPQEQSQAHNNGDIHIHDLDFFAKTLTCVQIPVGKLLLSGFNNGHGYIRSPKGIKSAANLTAVIIQSSQNDMHGGQSVAFFDYDLAPFVQRERERQRKLFRELELDVPEEKIEQLVEKEAFQAMEALIFNLNTMHSRAGAQVPFSSVNFGTDTSPDGRIITKSLLLAYEAGLGKGENPIFPNLIFKLKKGINMEPEDPNYDLFKLALRVTSKRMFPTYSFLDSTFNKSYSGERESEVAYMGCRTRVIGNVCGPEVTEGRGNASFTTINLPRLALKARGDIPEFFRVLDNMLNLVKEQLLFRFEVQSRLRVKDMPFLMGQNLYLDSDKLGFNDEVREAIKHATLSIGFIGLAETLIVLTGNHHGASEEADDLGEEIIAFMRSKCDAYSEEYRLNFSLLGTPAEGLSGRFVKMDRKEFGVIKDVTDRKYYTNSSHIPVWHDISMQEKARIEGKYHKYENAGHILYLEMPSVPQNNLEALEAIIRHMAACDVGYGAVNFPIDFCKLCGHLGVINEDICPACGSVVEEEFELEEELDTEAV